MKTVIEYVPYKLPHFMCDLWFSHVDKECSLPVYDAVLVSNLSPNLPMHKAPYPKTP
jgi:hypothetical protein